MIDEICLYFHIPFCPRRCFYCDYFSLAVGADEGRAAAVGAGGGRRDSGSGGEGRGGSGGSSDLFMRFVRALIERTDRALDFLSPGRIPAVFIGGGTPSHLGVEAASLLFDSLRRRLGPVDEFSVEVNPESLSEGFLQAAEEGGVNRISLGVQTYSGELLHHLGRPAGIEELLRAEDTLRRCWNGRVNRDLLTALRREPGGLKRDLDAALADNPGHISLYELAWEGEGRGPSGGAPARDKARLSNQATPGPGNKSAPVGAGLPGRAEGALGGDEARPSKGAPARNSRLPAPPDEEERTAEREEALAQLERAAYRRYEVCHFAKEGQECLYHENLGRLNPYLGIGPGAASTLPASVFHPPGALRTAPASRPGVRTVATSLPAAQQIPAAPSSPAAQQTPAAVRITPAAPARPGASEPPLTPPKKFAASASETSSPPAAPTSPTPEPPPAPLQNPVAPTPPTLPPSHAALRLTAPTDLPRWLNTTDRIRSGALNFPDALLTDASPEALSAPAFALEHFITALKTAAGLDRSRFSAVFGTDPLQIAPRALELGQKLGLLRITENTIAPTAAGFDRIQGILISIAAEIDEHFQHPNPGPAAYRWPPF